MSMRVIGALPKEIDACLPAATSMNEMVRVLVTNQLDPKMNGVCYMKRAGCRTEQGVITMGCKGKGKGNGGGKKK